MFYFHVSAEVYSDFERCVACVIHKGQKVGPPMTTLGFESATAGHKRRVGEATGTCPLPQVVARDPAKPRGHVQPHDIHSEAVAVGPAGNETVAVGPAFTVRQ